MAFPNLTTMLSEQTAAARSLIEKIAAAPAAGSHELTASDWKRLLVAAIRRMQRSQAPHAQLLAAEVHNCISGVTLPREYALQQKEERIQAIERRKVTTVRKARAGVDLLAVPRTRWPTMCSIATIRKRVRTPASYQTGYRVDVEALATPRSPPDVLPIRGKTSAALRAARINAALHLVAEAYGYDADSGETAAHRSPCVLDPDPPADQTTLDP